MNHYLFDDGWRWYHKDVEHQHSLEDCVAKLWDNNDAYIYHNMQSTRLLPMNWLFVHVAHGEPSYGYQSVLDRMFQS